MSTLLHTTFSSVLLSDLEVIINRLELKKINRSIILSYNVTFCSLSSSSLEGFE